MAPAPMEQTCNAPFPKTSLRVAKVLQPCVVAMAWLALLGIIPTLVSQVVYSFEVMFRTDNRVVTALAFPAARIDCWFGDDHRTPAQKEYDIAISAKMYGLPANWEENLDGGTLEKIWRESRTREVQWPGTDTWCWRDFVDWTYFIGMALSAFLGLVLSVALRDRCVALAKSNPPCAEMFPDARPIKFRQACNILAEAGGTAAPAWRMSLWRGLIYLCGTLALLFMLNACQMGPPPAYPHGMVLFFHLAYAAFFVSCIILFSHLHRTLREWEKQNRPL